MSNTQPLIQYIRPKFGKAPTGVLVAVKNGNTVNIGYALCKTSGPRPDKWNRSFGLELAKIRAQKGVITLAKDSEMIFVREIPESLTRQENLPKFEDRVRRYFFKNA